MTTDAVEYYQTYQECDLGLEASHKERIGEACGSSLDSCRQDDVRSLPYSALVSRSQYRQAWMSDQLLIAALGLRGTHFVNDPRTFLARSLTAPPKSSWGVLLSTQGRELDRVPREKMTSTVPSFSTSAPMVSSSTKVCQKGILRLVDSSRGLAEECEITNRSRKQH
jgi:hypothetical protein